jgi:hypothetical protein
VPRQVIGSDVAVGNLIQQGPKSRFSLQNSPRSFAERPLRATIIGKVRQLIPVNANKTPPIYPLPEPVPWLES